MMRILWAILFWVFLVLFCIDAVNPSYTNAENNILLAILFRYCWRTEYTGADD